MVRRITELAYRYREGYLFRGKASDTNKYRSTVWLFNEFFYWRTINQQKPVLTSQLGTEGVRDPFLFQTQSGDYVLLATDLRMYGHTKPGAWTQAEVAGSDKLIVWYSKDLVTWSSQRAITLGPNFGCVWAPEAIYDREYQDYRLFWSSTDTTESLEKLRIYTAHTKDFMHFTKAAVYLGDAAYDVIDLDVVAADAGYYRFWKLNQRGQVVMDHVTTLDSATDQPVVSAYLAKMYHVEGPQAYRLPDGRWVLLLDQVNNDVRAYVPVITDELPSGQFTQPPADTYQLPVHPRHGSVLPIDQAAYQRLMDRWG